MKKQPEKISAFSYFAHALLFIGIVSFFALVLYGFTVPVYDGPGYRQEHVKAAP